MRTKTVDIIMAVNYRASDLTGKLVDAFTAEIADAEIRGWDSAVDIVIHSDSLDEAIEKIKTQGRERRRLRPQF
jgi:hypothetical protein